MNITNTKIEECPTTPVNSLIAKFQKYQDFWPRINRLKGKSFKNFDDECQFGTILENKGVQKLKLENNVLISLLLFFF